MHMNTQKAAQWFGWILLLVGVLGFIPGIVTSSGLLLGIFQVDALHNIIHILTGLIGIFAAGGLKASKNYFKIFGIVYALVTILGFIGGTSVLGLIAINAADNWLHVVITLVALYFGFRKEGVVTVAM